MQTKTEQISVFLLTESMNPPPRRNPLHVPPRPGQSPRRGFYENEVLHAYRDGTVSPQGRTQGSPVLQPNPGPPQAGILRIK